MSSRTLSHAILVGDNPFYGLGATMTDEQLEFIKAYESGKKILFLDSIAGGGKTTIATALAKYLLDTYPKLFKQAKYIFAPVNEKEMGFRPGSQKTKEEDYLTPLKDALLKINELPEKAISRFDEEGDKIGLGWIEAASHVFMRGTNLPEQIIIIDESQNFTKKQLKKVLSRVHDSSLIFVIGHSGQCDLPNADLSGFVPYLAHYNGHPLAWSGKFTHNFRGEIAKHADLLAV